MKTSGRSTTTASAIPAVEERLRNAGADIERVVLEVDLRREYQEWLQAHNKGNPESDGRPDRDPREIERWAHERDLPYLDEYVRFPDFRIEYERDGRDREDVEVMSEHYRGAYAAGKGQAGFTCYGSGSGRGGVGAAATAAGPSIRIWREITYDAMAGLRTVRQRPLGARPGAGGVRVYRAPGTLPPARAALLRRLPRASVYHRDRVCPAEVVC